MHKDLVRVDLVAHIGRRTGRLGAGPSVFRWYFRTTVAHRS